MNQREMDRRTFLALGGLGIAAAALPGCATVTPPPTIDLPPLDVTTAGPLRKGRIIPADQNKPFDMRSLIHAVLAQPSE